MLTSSVKLLSLRCKLSCDTSNKSSRLIKPISLLAMILGTLLYYIGGEVGLSCYRFNLTKEEISNVGERTFND